jgi:peptide/nickel transport system substrate-binding protein
MNNESGPMSDLKARQAARHAIDHQALMDTCWAGRGELIGSMVPPTDPWYEDLSDFYTHDPQRARQLVEQAGGPVRLRLRVPNLLTPSRPRRWSSPTWPRSASTP